MAAPYLALGFAGPHLLELTSDPALLARWDALPVAYSVLGIDRIDGSPPASVTLSSSAAAAHLAGATRGGRFLVTATPQRDHPYNIARRTASLGHLSRGRSGVLIGVRDAYAPSTHADTPVRGHSERGGPAPLNAQTAFDAARAVRLLEQSWPYDSIIGDRDNGILVQSNRISHVDIDTSFSIAGPLNVPEPATGASVIAWYAASVDDAPPAERDSPIDLVLGAAGPVPVVSLGEQPPAEVRTGVVLRAGLDDSVSDLLDTAERWLADGFAAVAPGTPLRAALGLAAPAPLPSTARAAFPVPRSHVSL